MLKRVEDAEWTCPQPDVSLVAWSLATHRIIALLRRVAFPVAVRGYVVEFPAALIGLPVLNAVRRKFESLCVALALSPNYYQLDIPAKAGRGFLCRRTGQLQRAPRVSPAWPSSTGLRHRVAHTLDESGDLAVLALTAHLGAVVGAEARVLKRCLLPTELGGRRTPSGPGDEEDIEDDEDPGDTPSLSHAAI